MKPLALAALVLAFPAVAQARDQIRIVGSSTVFPFSATVVERFGQTTKFKAPTLESTGTVAGLRLFCSGVGADHPDLAGASRRMSRSEREDCARNGIDEITELAIGLDGVVLAHSKERPSFNVTKAQLFLALAKEVVVGGAIGPNPHKLWSEIDPSFPAAEIEIIGPPPTSGTRDAVEQAMEAGCLALPAVKALPSDRRTSVCRTVREDGAFTEAGEDDERIVRRLEQNPNAFGLFGFSYLEEHLDTLAANPVNGVAPSFDSIAAGAYGLSRPLYLYVKNAHVGVIPGLAELVAEYTSERAMGDEGYLADKGLIPLPAAAQAASREAAERLTPMRSPAE